MALHLVNRVSKRQIFSQAIQATEQRSAQLQDSKLLQQISEEFKHNESEAQSPQLPAYRTTSAQNVLTLTSWLTETLPTPDHYAQYLQNNALDISPELAHRATQLLHDHLTHAPNRQGFIDRRIESLSRHSPSSPKLQRLHKTCHYYPQFLTFPELLNRPPDQPPALPRLPSGKTPRHTAALYATHPLLYLADPERVDLEFRRKQTLFLDRLKVHKLAFHNCIHFSYAVLMTPQAVLFKQMDHLHDIFGAKLCQVAVAAHQTLLFADVEEVARVVEHARTWLGDSPHAGLLTARYFPGIHYYTTNPDFADDYAILRHSLPFGPLHALHMLLRARGLGTTWRHVTPYTLPPYRTFAAKQYQCQRQPLRNHNFLLIRSRQLGNINNVRPRDELQASWVKVRIGELDRVGPHGSELGSVGQQGSELGRGSSQGAQGPGKADVANVGSSILSMVGSTTPKNNECSLRRIMTQDLIDYKEILPLSQSHLVNLVFLVRAPDHVPSAWDTQRIVADVLRGGVAFDDAYARSRTAYVVALGKIRPVAVGHALVNVMEAVRQLEEIYPLHTKHFNVITDAACTGLKTSPDPTTLAHQMRQFLEAGLSLATQVQEASTLVYTPARARAKRVPARSAGTNDVSLMLLGLQDPWDYKAIVSQSMYSARFMPLLLARMTRHCPQLLSLPGLLVRHRIQLLTSRLKRYPIQVTLTINPSILLCPAQRVVDDMERLESLLVEEYGLLQRDLSRLHQLIGVPFEDIRENLRKMLTAGVSGGSDGKVGAGRSDFFRPLMTKEQVINAVQSHPRILASGADDMLDCVRALRATVVAEFDGMSGKARTALLKIISKPNLARMQSIIIQKSENISSDDLIYQQSVAQLDNFLEICLSPEQSPDQINHEQWWILPNTEAVKKLQNRVQEKLKQEPKFLDMQSSMQDFADLGAEQLWAGSVPLWYSNQINSLVDNQNDNFVANQKTGKPVAPSKLYNKQLQEIEDIVVQTLCKFPNNFQWSKQDFNQCLQLLVAASKTSGLPVSVLLLTLYSQKYSFTKNRSYSYGYLTSDRYLQEWIVQFSYRMLALRVAIEQANPKLAQVLPTMSALTWAKISVGRSASRCVNLYDLPTMTLQGLMMRLHKLSIFLDWAQLPVIRGLSRAQRTGLANCPSDIKQSMYEGFHAYQQLRSSSINLGQRRGPGRPRKGEGEEVGSGGGEGGGFLVS